MIASSDSIEGATERTRNPLDKRWGVPPANNPLTGQRDASEQGAPQVGDVREPSHGTIER